MEASMTLRITEAELVRDVRGVLDKIERGNEVIIEREDHRPLAVIKQPQPVGREIGECIALAKAYEEKIGDAPVLGMRTSPGTSRTASTRTGNQSATSGTSSAWD